jgi:hypothetical protein
MAEQYRKMAIFTPVTKVSFCGFFAEGLTYETFDISAALQRLGLAPASPLPAPPPPPSSRDTLREHFARTFNARSRRRFLRRNGRSRRLIIGQPPALR